MTTERPSIESFGYLHAIPPGDGLLIDLRDRIHDPHIDPKMREMTGLDDLVYRKVLNTQGARDLIANILDRTIALYRVRGSAARVLIGCQGGRHRSVVIARIVSERLSSYGIENDLIHHHVERPVVHR